MAAVVFPISASMLACCSGDCRLAGASARGAGGAAVLDNRGGNIMIRTNIEKAPSARKRMATKNSED